MFLQGMPCPTGESCTGSSRGLLLGTTHALKAKDGIWEISCLCSLVEMEIWPRFRIALPQPSLSTVGKCRFFCVAVQYCTVQEGHCSLLLCLQTAGSSWNNTQSILYLQWVKLLQPDFLSKRFPTSVRDSQPRPTATHEHTRLEHSHFST